MEIKIWILNKHNETKIPSFDPKILNIQKRFANFIRYLNLE